MQGAIIGAGMNAAAKALNGEPIDGEEIVETAIVSGADFGVKTATAGALKVASEKGILKIIPKGTSGNTFANIAFVAIENVKVLGKVAKGKLTVEEGFYAMEQTTCSCVAGIALYAKGTAVGVAIGSVLGPVGMKVGGFVGGVVGYALGSKAGEVITKGYQKIRKKAEETIKFIGNKIGNGLKSAANNALAFLGI